MFLPRENLTTPFNVLAEGSNFRDEDTVLRRRSLAIEARKNSSSKWSHRFWTGVEEKLAPKTMANVKKMIRKVA